MLVSMPPDPAPAALGSLCGDCLVFLLSQGPRAPAIACHGGFPGHSGNRLWQQPQSPSAGDGLGAVSRAELVENVADMLLDGVEHHDKLVGDLPV